MIFDATSYTGKPVLTDASGKPLPMLALLPQSSLTTQALTTQAVEAAMNAHPTPSGVVLDLELGYWLDSRLVSAGTVTQAEYDESCNEAMNRMAWARMAMNSLNFSSTALGLFCLPFVNMYSPPDYSSLIAWQAANSKLFAAMQGTVSMGACECYLRFDPNEPDWDIRYASFLMQVRAEWTRIAQRMPLYPVIEFITAPDGDVTGSDVGKIVPPAAMVKIIQMCKMYADGAIIWSSHSAWGPDEAAVYAAIKAVL